MEIIKKEDAVQIENDKEYLSSDKAVYKPELEESEEEVATEDVVEDEIDF